MCGIVGIVAKHQVNVVDKTLSCLRTLEYRGYDSAGIAVSNEQNNLDCLKLQGKVEDLIELEKSHPLHGNIAISHTRWATHGTPSDRNAHPHISHGKIAVVHNGIIENYESIKKLLVNKGYEFVSETDTEVIAHYIHYFYAQEKNFLRAVQRTASELHGNFALLILNSDVPEQVIAVRCGSPLVIGLGSECNFVASDVISLLEFTNKFVYMEEGDIAVVENEKLSFYDSALNPVQRTTKISDLKHEATDKGRFAHYMLKEIYEQPQTIKATLNSLESEEWNHLRKLSPKIKHIQIVACGSSFYAGLMARNWIEANAQIPCSVEIASEFRYRETIAEPGTLFVTISQSGETADTLAALRLAKQRQYLSVLSICNVPESSLVREADARLMTHAGIEIGVATTKAFTSQMIVLLWLALVLAKERNLLTADQYLEYQQHSRRLPLLVEKVLMQEDKICALAQSLVAKEHAFYLGRGINYSLALEGALKLKELAYLHAEAFPAGELKHGPLALVDKNIPIIVLAPSDNLLDKIKANIQEVLARGGEILVLTDNAELNNNKVIQALKMPVVHSLLAPVVYLPVLQLLAYHVAVLRGHNVDQPRNLAKSVTVE